MNSPGSAARPDSLIKVLCVEDSADLASLLCMVINAEPDMSVVGQIDRADDLVAEAERLHPNVLLLDLNMPGKDPIVALEELCRVNQKIRTIVFSGADGQERVNRAVEAGAWGYVSKHQEMTEVIAAIRRVAAGEFVLAT